VEAELQKAVGKNPVANLAGDASTLAESMAGVHETPGAPLVGERAENKEVGSSRPEAPPRRVPRNTAEQTAQEKVWYQMIVDQTISSSLMKRYGTIDEQVNAICFLASDEASYITGVTMPVGGGDLG
jgi:NAD(P)-dependent dehydrogenase (short-subunit alcohol dehydrogenase family)